jgi:hypothetical protein
MNKKQLNDLSESLGSRARRARRSAWYSAALIIITVFAMIVFFYGVRAVDRYMYADIGFKLSDTAKFNLVTLAKQKEDRTAPTEDPKLTEKKLDLELKKAELDLRRAELNKGAEESSRMLSVITDSATKIGAVLISIYLIQILLGLMRYHFKLADHLATISDALKISNDDIDKLIKMTEAIGVAHIDFGKNPQTPIDKLTEIIKGVAGQVESLKKHITKKIRRRKMRVTDFRDFFLINIYIQEKL